MEFLHNNYLIKYISNVDDFRINVYCKINGKKYELIESGLVKKYKDIGMDLFQILTECFSSNLYTVDDKDSYLIFCFEYMELIKLSVTVPNVLCEYKDASVLDLKSEIESLKLVVSKLGNKIYELSEKNKFLTDLIDELNTEICIGDGVKIPKDIKSAVICEWIGLNPKYEYIDIFKIAIMQSQNATIGYVTKTYPTNMYYGYKNACKNSLDVHFVPSDNEFYKDPTTTFLCFKNMIDCELIKNIKFDKLGLFNIKVKNISRLNVKGLYLTNVEFLDNDVFPTCLIELGLKNCKNISSKMLKSIKIYPKFFKIHILESNVKKSDLPSDFNIIES